MRLRPAILEIAPGDYIDAFRVVAAYRKAGIQLNGSAGLLRRTKMPRRKSAAKKTAAKKTVKTASSGRKKVASRAAVANPDVKAGMSPEARNTLAQKKHDALEKKRQLKAQARSAVAAPRKTARRGRRAKRSYF